jgi:hypothetical protein
MLEKPHSKQNRSMLKAYGKFNYLEYHKMFGQLLGYPPKAVDFYVRKCTDRSLAGVSIGLGYSGVRCVSDVREYHMVV